MPQEGTAQVVRNLPKFEDPDLLVGAEHFSDAGVYRLTPSLAIVQSVDFFPPLVDDPYVFGQIAAANSLSDIYATGARPRTALNIVCFPDDKLELDILHEILRGGSERVKAAGAVIVGGHSVRDQEIKYGLAATGTVHPEEIFTNDRARPGDVLFLTKPIGTGFVTTAYKKNRCPDETFFAACDSMIELNAAGARVARLARASAVTDVTGFGLGGHATEMAMASGVTVKIVASRVPLIPGVEELARQGFKNRAVKSNYEWGARYARIESHVPQHLIDLIYDPQTSGGLLLSIPEDRVPVALDEARKEGLKVFAEIGRVYEHQGPYLVIE